MKQRVLRRTLASLSVLILITACSKSEPQDEAKAPAEVGIVIARATPTAVATELPGRMEPYREAEVRARVAGIVARLYEEGQDVKRGDALFQIDPAPLQAAYDSEAANLARAQAACPPRPTSCAAMPTWSATAPSANATTPRPPPTNARPAPRWRWRAPTCKAPS